MAFPGAGMWFNPAKYHHIMDLQALYEKAADFGHLSVEEGVFLYHHAPLTDLMFIADELRKKQVW